ncbi:MAG: hypothetical protein AAGF88_03255 [Pseudomonadota bacterium]
MDNYPYNLGPHTYPITANRSAQIWFDRGLQWTFGFNHDEAVRCFKRAAEADPDAAMAHWGVAYATGPNYNLPWDLWDDAGRAKALLRAREATEAALERADGVSEAEAALIHALPARFPQANCASLEDMARWDDAFATVMRDVQRQYPGNREIRAVAVEAMMQRTPWAMWDLASGKPATGADTEICRALLEAAFTEDPEAMTHPGLLHLYVHLMEMSPTPEVALPHADRLRDLVPDAGHLVHMPTHIDVQCGAYHDVVYWNTRAVEADMLYFEREGAFNVYTGYRQHNLHFIAYGAMFLGQFEPALAALRSIKDTTPEDMLRIESPPMADFFESYLSFEPHLLVRFGMWEACLKLETPDDPVLYATVNANTLYAKGVALAALGRAKEARAMQSNFLAAAAAVPPTRWLHTNLVVDILEIAKAMLEGEILYREGEFDAAFDMLRHAVALEDGLNYDEPWGWMQPVRHALGALLLEQGHVEEAEACFRADLGLSRQLPRATMHPDNIWALRGLCDCLLARRATEELALFQQRLSIAEARADRPVKAACGCAAAAMEA